MAKDKSEWSNNVISDSVEREIRAMTPHERHVAALADKMKDVPPKTYTVTSTNAKALRVIHDFYGTAVSIEPGTKKEGVQLLPDVAAYLGKGDLKLEETA